MPSPREGRKRLALSNVITGDRAVDLLVKSQVQDGIYTMRLVVPRNVSVIQAWEILLYRASHLRRSGRRDELWETSKFDVLWRLSRLVILSDNPALFELKLLVASEASCLLSWILTQEMDLSIEQSLFRSQALG